MNRRIRIGAIALILVISPVLASCQAVANLPKATPDTAVKSHMASCTPGARDETIQPLGLKMISATTGWAPAQCAVGAQPTFAGGSTVECRWPRIESAGILRTTDGGQTWIDASPPSVPNRTWHHTQFFLDSTHAWVAEASRTAAACVSQVTIFRTSDGGKTWQQAGAVPVKNPKPSDDIFNVYGSQDWMGFVDPQHGWLLVVSPQFSPSAMITASTLYMTEDGGSHWRLIATNPGMSALSAVATCHPNTFSIGGIRFTSATTGWMLVACPAQTVLTTQDSGATWRAQQLPDCVCQVYQPIFIDSTHAAITGSNSAVMLATADGGASWVQHQLPAAALRFFSFTDPNNGWLVAVEQLPKSYDTAVHRTTDGGKSWSLLGKPGFATSTSTKNAYYPISSLQFVDANVGFVALGPLAGPQMTGPDTFGPQFQLLGTQDGGRSWKTLLKQVLSRPCITQYTELGNSNVSLMPVKYANATTAWAKGGLRTTDGGARWRDVSSAALREGASTPLYPPGYTDFYLDADHAWQAGIYGSETTCSDHVTTFATSDGGKSWKQSTPIQLDLPSGYRAGTVQFGFPTAQSGWLFVPMGIPSNDMWGGPAATTGYLFETSDGGLAWRRVATLDASPYKGLLSNSKCQSQLGQITFASTTAGWMTLNCVNSKILVTKDGGVSWTVQSSPIPCECQLALPNFVDQKHGFMQIYGGGKTPGGNNVMATSDGGATWQTLPQVPLPSTIYLMGLTFADANNLWALVTPPGWNKGTGGKFSLYHSKDGGQSWSVVQDGLPLGRGAYPLLFADEKHGMVTQSRNATWSLDTPNYIDGQDMVLAVTSDGGHTWKIFKPAIGG